MALMSCSRHSLMVRPRKGAEITRVWCRYVVDRILLGDFAEMRDYSFDLDDHGAIDNYLGQSIRVAYGYLGRDSQAALDEAVATGEMMHLIMLGAPDAEFLDTAAFFSAMTPTTTRATTSPAKGSSRFAQRAASMVHCSGPSKATRSPRGSARSRSRTPSSAPFSCRSLRRRCEASFGRGYPRPRDS